MFAWIGQTVDESIDTLVDQDPEGAGIYNTSRGKSLRPHTRLVTGVDDVPW
jgi:hypothetical protein